MNEKCGKCPLATEDRHCPGQYNPKACDLSADRLLRSTGPGPIEKVVNFVGAVASHAAAGMPTASEEVKASRLAICRDCENYAGGSCRLCGCGLDRKAAWADQSCPIGLWGPITSPSAP